MTPLPLLVVESLGSRLGITAPGPAHALLADLLAPLLAAPGEGAPTGCTEVLRLTHGSGWSLHEDGAEVLAGEPELHVAVARLLERLNGRLLDAAPVLAVHAGVLGLPGGGVVALPAVSGTGKSTMTAALVRAGATYLSDEALALSAGLGVTPYPRPLLLAADRAVALGLPPPMLRADEVGYPPALLGAVAPAGERPLLTDVVRLDRRPGPVELAPMPGVQVAGLLLEHAFNHYRDPRLAFAVASAAATGCRGWSLGYAEAPDGARLLLEQLVPA